jgi:hypothetical protein
MAEKNVRDALAAIGKALRYGEAKGYSTEVTVCFNSGRFLVFAFLSEEDFEEAAAGGDTLEEAFLDLAAMLTEKPADG